MPELFLELRSEEIPARMQFKAADDLQRMVCDGLKANGLSFGKAQSFVTPRRLALVVDDVPAAQPDIKEEKRGPRVGAPQAALDGFLKSAGLTLEQCEKRDTGKGEFWFATVESKGRPSAVVVKELIEKTMGDFPWPKSMRWGSHSVRWVRPLHSILCFLGGESVGVEFGPIRASDYTVGHRFLAPHRILHVHDFANYRMAMRRASVVLDQNERREIIARDVAKLAANEGYSVKDDPGLLDEVTGLVEWPVALAASIDEAFMDVPSEVLITAMRSHQKYFALLKADGSLAPRFVLIANRSTPDGGRQIIAGNERVLRARLSDAKFFWDQDRKNSLESYTPKLSERIYHAKLGSMAEKVGRLAALSEDLCQFVPGADAKLARRAAELCKADLSTGMVGEFPELQGIMGRYYALHSGEKPEVAQAIAEHYSPAGPSDRCPTAPLSVVVSLADKLDALVNFFAIEEKPTGSKDPFALRRAALGVIRLIVENNLRLGLVFVFKAAVKSGDKEKVAGELLDFFADRLKVHLKEKGVRHDLVSAVFALGGEDDLVRLLARVTALGDFLASDDGANLLVAYRRAANILRIEEKKDGKSYNATPDAALLQETEEKALFASLAKADAEFGPHLAAERFADAMGALAQLRLPVDAFFDKVTVNSEDRNLRENRLKLLSQIRSAMDKVADFSKIEG